jgi:3-oxoacyl-[acyl-carrier protein] reductase
VAWLEKKPALAYSDANLTKGLPVELGLSGKTAIVCGASRGMGKAIAKKLAEEGANVVIVARNRKDLLSAAKEISSAGEVLVVAADLSSASVIPGIVKQAVKKFGAVHILINNAGGPPPGTFNDVTDKDWEKTFQQNLKSAILMTRQVVPLMKKAKFGRILNIASQVVKEPPPGMVLSNTLRAGVVAFAKSISHELAPFNITVNTLLPGPVLTDRLQFLVKQRAKKEGKSVNAVIQSIAQSVPVKRIGSPEEFANVAVFLVSEAASYVTGTTLAVDGGITKSLM